MAHTAAEILCRDQFYGGQAGQRQTCRPGGASSTTTTNLSHQPHQPFLRNYFHQKLPISHKTQLPTFRINQQPPVINLSHQPPRTTTSNLSPHPPKTLSISSTTTTDLTFLFNTQKSFLCYHPELDLVCLQTQG